ncbi:NAD(P)-dependent oxidoreductase [Enterococcus gilvus]|uniref:NAD(P)-dependent oxidoreductase n=1 Tax=Enterococcus gilvus TaxID=160453 RepID=UPI001C8CCF25|nr:NAD(P)H-binding protein [Enterococcus gilvus]MBX8937609.1 NAD(P)H-binding protein [Enterococcus gilvus]
MKIAIIAANGKTGQLITKEAVEKGLDVTAVVRHENKTAAAKTLQKDVFDLTKEDLQEFDVVVDALGFWAPEDLEKHQTSLKHLADCLSGSKTYLYVVGGAGSLYVNSNHTQELKDTPDFLEAFKPLAINMSEALGALRKRTDVNWVYVSPAADFQAEGEKTGRCEVAGEEYMPNAKGESYISYADYAIGMLGAIVDGNYHQERISLYTK